MLGYRGMKEYRIGDLVYWINRDTSWSYGIVCNIAYYPSFKVYWFDVKRIEWSSLKYNITNISQQRRKRKEKNND
jgi:hypothetical protein